MSLEVPSAGLRSAEVADRRARGLANDVAERTSRSIAEILSANLLTRFNVIMGSLLAVILLAGQPQDAVFGIVLVANALIGIAQELRAKRTLDRLTVLSAPRVRVIRDGRSRVIGARDLVVADVVDLAAGDPLVADGLVCSSEGLQADESLITGESDPVDKRAGDRLLSGSFIVAGSGRCEVTDVGAQAYARRLAAEARQFSLVRSELMDGINKILRYVTWAIVPVAALLMVSQLHLRDGASAALTRTVAALVGMVPQGLVLLTSIAFGVAAVKLARRRVLVQQLAAVEGLARVDVVCFDKTGTLTDGTIAFDELIQLDGDAPVAAALGALAADKHPNATLAAIGNAFPAPHGWDRVASVPFSPDRKWSAASFTGHGSWVLGAPELVLPASQQAVLSQAADLAASGRRVLVIGHAPAQDRWSDGPVPPVIQPAALVLLAERLRDDTRDAIAYFKAQGVALKVISGDSPRTAYAVAAQSGVPVFGDPVDARNLPEGEDTAALGSLLEDHSVFGRVTPRQKQAMVKALQARGHTVAMTGDGVNDVLALKLADLGVAMGSAAPATRAVAELVLLDSRFAALPRVMAEGRRVTANIERVANLFLTKTVWATLLAVAVGVTLLPFPFLPRHLTIIDTVAIGVPSYFLALAPNTRRYLSGFIGRVLRFAVPAGAIVAAAAFTTFYATRAAGLPVVQQHTAATVVTTVLSLAVLVLLAMPITWWRILLVAAAAAGFMLLFLNQDVRRFYALQVPLHEIGLMLVVSAVGAAMLACIGALSNGLGRLPSRH